MHTVVLGRQLDDSLGPLVLGNNWNRQTPLRTLQDQLLMASSPEEVTDSPD